jgi:hypothetical protein
MTSNAQFSLCYRLNAGRPRGDRHFSLSFESRIARMKRVAKRMPSHRDGLQLQGVCARRRFVWLCDVGNAPRAAWDLIRFDIN